MKWTLGLAFGVTVAMSAVGVGCSDPPRIATESRSTVSSTLATYDATAETKSKYGITKWRLRHVGDGSVLEGLDRSGKRVSHISLAVRKGKKADAAMFWFSGTDKRKGFVKTTRTGLARNTLPGTVPNWSIAARRDLLKFAASGKTPYGCADDIFGILSSLLQGAPSCAKTDGLQACIAKMSSSGGNQLGKAAGALKSCMPSLTGSSSSSSGGTSSGSAAQRTGSSSSSGGTTGNTSSSSGSSGSSGSQTDKDTTEKDTTDKDTTEKDTTEKDTDTTEKDTDTTEKDTDTTEKESSPDEEKKQLDEKDPVEQEKVADVDEKDPVEKEQDQEKDEKDQDPGQSEPNPEPEPEPEPDFSEPSNEPIEA